VKLLLTLRSHPGVKAIEYLTPDGKHSVIRVGGWRQRKRVEVGGMVPRPDFGVGGPSGIARLTAMMLVARLTGDEAVAPPDMGPSDVAAAFRLAESISADLEREGLFPMGDEDPEPGRAS
jgi:hypothetical protein